MKLFDRVVRFCLENRIDFNPPRQIKVNNYLINTSKSFFGCPIECLVLNNDGDIVDGYSLVPYTNKNFWYNGNSFSYYIEILRKNN